VCSTHLSDRLGMLLGASRTSAFFDKKLLQMGGNIGITLLHVKEILTPYAGCGADDRERNVSQCPSSLANQ
jgi:hypothetical protein